MATGAVRWWDAYPKRLQSELDAMAAIAPELTWTEDLPETTGGGWTGQCPSWPFDRPAPAHLDAFLGGRRLQIEVRLSPAHPVVCPAITPVDPVPDMHTRTMHRWHLLGDGNLCLLRDALSWTGTEPAAELVRKAAGWFLEYLLLDAGTIEDMSEDGIVVDDHLDVHFTGAAS